MNLKSQAFIFLYNLFFTNTMELWIIIPTTTKGKHLFEHLIPMLLVVLFIKKKKEKNDYPITLFIECQSYCVYI